MHPSKKATLQSSIVIFDCVVAISAPMVAVAFRGIFEARLDMSWDILPYAMTSSLASLLLLWWFGVMRAAWRYFAFSDALRAMQCIAMAVAIGAVAGFAVNRLDGVPRSIPLIHIILQAGAFVAVRALMQRLLSTKSRRSPARPGGVLVIGCNPTAEAYVRAVEVLSQGALEVAGLLAEDAAMVGLTVRGKQVLGTISQVRSALTSLQVHGIDLQKIAVAVPEKSLSALHHAALDRILAETRIPVIYLDSLFGEATGSDMEQEAVHPKVGRALRSYGPLKNCLDILASCILLVVTSPLFAAVALLTLIDLGQPICFWQKRMGRRGQSITLYKFRTMRSPLGPHGEKLTDVQRTSKIGHFLRKTRLDELPQLLNIFHGDMSFVGPRPLLPIDQPAEVMERLSVKPGLTGWAQVNGGKLVTPEEKRALDLWYVGHANLWLDLKIAWMTLEMFVRGDRLNTATIIAATDWLHLRDSMAIMSLDEIAPPSPEHLDAVVEFRQPGQQREKRKRASAA